MLPVVLTQGLLLKLHRHGVVTSLVNIFPIGGLTVQSVSESIEILRLSLVLAIDVEIGPKRPSKVRSRGEWTSSWLDIEGLW